ncbi:MAG: hypothetical protein ACREL5_04310 [Gemmatimonadales bacterium]
MRPDRAGLLLLTLLSAVSGAGAQASQFNVRGLGLPGREESARTLSLGGAIGLFDGESSRNPAALATLTNATALFTSTGDWRSTTNPSGTLSGRDTRFPQVLIGGPIPHHPFAIAASYSLYSDRDFTVVSNTTAAPRGIDVPVHDTLSSRGGIDDLRFGASWAASTRLAVGAAIHLYSGSNRLASRRYWEDTSYLAPQETAELSYAATGVSLGFVWQPLPLVQVAGTWQHAGALGVERDSTGNGQVLFPTATIGSVPMPTTVAAALRLAPSRRLAISAAVTLENWSVADSSLRAQGAPGARNSRELNAGLEFFRDTRRPLKYPIRLGVRYSTLPFLLTTQQPSEFGIAVGTGRRFAQERGGFDIAIEHVWRSGGVGYHESATLITVGISVRPVSTAGR